MMETFNSKNWTAEEGHPADEELLMLLDGELSVKELALGRTHLDACWTCRARVDELQSTITSFVKYNDSILNPLIDLAPRGWGGFKARLNNAVVELGKPQPWYRNVLGIGGRIGLFNFASGFFATRRAAFVPAALVLALVGLLAWFAISPSSAVSADEVLNESERRTSIWQNQPDKVLHWGYETTLVNHPRMPDGKYFSRHWQYNIGGQALRLNRWYDANGNLVSASARRADGSYLYYKPSRVDELRITPSRDALLSYAARLDEVSRRVLENYVRSDDQAWEVSSERDLEIKRKYTQSSSRSLQILQSQEFGKVFRIRQVINTGGDKSIRMEIDEDIASDTFRSIRNHHVNYYPDGKISTEDSRLEFYRESTVEDFSGNDLSDMASQAKSLVRVAPEEILKEALRGEQERVKRKGK